MFSNQKSAGLELLAYGRRRQRADLITAVLWNDRPNAIDIVPAVLVGNCFGQSLELQNSICNSPLSITDLEDKLSIVRGHLIVI